MKKQLHNPKIINQLYADFFAQMRPKPRLTVSQWADEFRYVSPESSSNPGKWHTDFVPYLKGIMDAANEPDAHMVVVMTAAQVGKSEAINNVMAYFAHQDPCPQLMIQPTLRDAEDYSKARISPMIRDTAVLKEIFEDSSKIKKANNTILEKFYPSGRLVMGGSNSPSFVSSKPIRVGLTDEVDRYEVTKEGDIIELLKTRMSTFHNWFLLMTSTPGTKGISRIEYWWNLSDQRKYFVPCLKCGKLQVLKWSQDTVVWDKDKNGNHLPETARYICEHCKSPLSDAELNVMIKKGTWKATKPNKGVIGFGDLVQFVAPWVNMSKVVKDFLDSKDDRDMLKVWVNTRLGQSYEEDSDQVSVNEIFERCERYEAIAPYETAVIVASVDVQDSWLEVLVEAYGKDEESWALENVRFEGDTSNLPENLDAMYQQSLFAMSPAKLTPWHKLYAFLQKTYEHESGMRMSISCTTIDTGGHRTDEVMRFCRMTSRMGVKAIKGSSQRGKAIVSKPTKRNKYGLSLYMLGTFTAKETLMARLHMKEPGPGYKHYPDRFDMEFFEQLTAEKKVKREKKRQFYYEWVKIRKRNEALDLSVYCLAAVRILFPDIRLLNKRVDHLLDKKAASVATPNEEKKPVENKIEVIRLNRNIKSKKAGFNNGWKI